jgi:hypothetical protein
VISALSRHSLIAYVAHLGLLYGLPLFRARTTHGLPGSYDIYDCSLACLLVLGLSIVSVLHWERLRALVEEGLCRLLDTKRARGPFKLRDATTFNAEPGFAERLGTRDISGARRELNEGRELS